MRPGLGNTACMVLFAGTALTLRAEDPDALFLQARQLPKARREEARELCLRALKDHPAYDEVRVHLARLYAWDERYDEARAQLRLILQPRPGNLEAREVAIDVEVWSDRPEEALRLCNEGLALEAPAARDTAVLLWRKARVLKRLGDLEGACHAIQVAVTVDPGFTEARLYREDLQQLRQRDKASLTFSRETYSQTFLPWTTGSLTLGHHFDPGTVLARVTRAERFSDRGTQMELEAYPHLFDHTYAFLNVGRSTSFMFPTTSAAAEIYHNFPHGIEASLGCLYLDFTGSKVTVRTGSFGVYAGNALYSLRLYETPSVAGASLSEALSGRWYFSDADSYAYLKVSSGFSQDLLAWSPQVFTLRTRSGSAGLQKLVGRRWIFSGGFTFERQEYFPAEFQNHLTTTVGVQVRF